GPERLAVRSTGTRRRGLLRAAGVTRHRAGGGRSVVWRRPGQRAAGPVGAATRDRAARPRVLVRAPGAGGRGMIATAVAVDQQHRGLVHNLISPHPLGQALPALYQEDDFTQR